VVGKEVALALRGIRGGRNHELERERKHISASQLPSARLPFALHCVWHVWRSDSAFPTPVPTAHMVTKGNTCGRKEREVFIQSTNRCPSVL
jgi:hypothetical protein